MKQPERGLSQYIKMINTLNHEVERIMAITDINERVNSWTRLITRSLFDTEKFNYLININDRFMGFHENISRIQRDIEMEIVANRPDEYDMELVNQTLNSDEFSLDTMRDVGKQRRIENMSKLGNATNIPAGIFSPKGKGLMSMVTHKDNNR